MKKNTGLPYLKRVLVLFLCTTWMSLSAAPQPVVSVSGETAPFLGNNFEFSVSLDNADLSDSGFFPVFHFIVPKEFMYNGSNDCETVGVSAINVQNNPLLASESIEVEDPYTEEFFTLQPGETFVSIKPNIGSHAPNQPDIECTVGLNYTSDMGSLLALENVAYTIRDIQGVYVIGGLVNGTPGPCGEVGSDSICSVAQTQNITPVLFTLKKLTAHRSNQSTGIGTGPTDPETVTITGTLSGSESLSNVTVVEEIPEILAITDPGDCSTFSISPNPDSCVYTPDPSAATGGEVEINYTTLSTNFNMSYSGSYKQFRDDASEILGSDLALYTESTNVSVDADELGATRTASANYRMYGIDFEKNWSLLSDIGGTGLTPLDTIQINHSLALNDYYEVNGLSFVDSLPDGLTYNDNSLVVTVDEGGVSTVLNENDLEAFGYFSYVENGDGTTDMSLDLASAMADTINFTFMDAILSGGGFFGFSSTTTISISYQATVDETFTTAPSSGDVSVDAGDELPLGTATITTYNVVGGDSGLSQTDATHPDAGEQGQPRIQGLTNTTVAITHINATPVMGMGNVHVSSGDEVTFKISVSIPSGDVEDLKLTNYLPNPLFLSAPCPTYDGAAIPANNTWSFGTNDPGLVDTDVSVNCDVGGNSIEFDVIDFDIAGGDSATLEIVFTTSVSNEPFTDGLLQSNLVITEYNDSSEISQAGATGTYAFIGDAPLITVSKSVESTNDTNAVIATGNVTDIDANAVITYLVELSNTGMGDAFDVSLLDTLPPGFEAPATSGGCSGPGCAYSISVSSECENTTTADTIAGVDETKVEITNMSIAAGQTCEVRFNLRLSPDNTWNTEYENEAVVRFASSPSGTLFSPEKDDSTATIESPSITGISASPASNGTVGELITFNIDVDFPQGQGTSTRLDLRELSDFWGTTTAMDYTVSVTGGVAGTGPYCTSDSGLSLCFSNDPSASLNASSATAAYINLGTSQNTATDLAGKTATFSIQAQLQDVSKGNKTVSGRYTFNDGSSDIDSDSSDLDFSLNRPTLSVVKCEDSATTALQPITLSDTLGYNIVIRNSGTFLSTAYDVANVTDTLTQGLKHTGASVNAYYCDAGASSINNSSCKTWTTGSCTGTLTDVSATVRSGESVEASPFGGNSRQELSFPIVDAGGNDAIGSNGYIVYQIQTEVSCDSVADSDGVNSPIGSHPDDDGILNGCTDPVLPFANTLTNAASLASYTTLDGAVTGEASYGSVSDTSDALTLDHDNDGIANSNEGSGDADGDGVPNYLDTDSDDNGSSDMADGIGDADGDGTPDYQDIDDDNDGINDADEITSSGGTMIDSDGDGLADQNDPDSDGDGIIDGDEGGIGTDTDMDGTDDYLDMDSDNDGIPDLLEHGFGAYDLDGSGVLSLAEITASGLDVNMNGAIDESELSGAVFADIDGDSAPNFRDLDADGDGLTDTDEANLTQFDDNLDNLITVAEAADIDDGMGSEDVASGAFDDNNMLNADEIPDTDGDGVPNFLDRDSDNDGVYDFVENRRYACDSNEDGFITSVEVAACGAVFTDSDGDGYLQLDEAIIPNSDASPPAGHAADLIPDYLDTDSDGDGINDWIEAYSSNIDINSDGEIDLAEYTAANSGGDLLFSELADSEETPDSTPDIFDYDSDDDGIYDLHESDASEIYPTYDASSVVSLYSNLFDSEPMPDGIPDFRDLDADGDSYPDSDEAGDMDITTVPEANDNPSTPDFQNFSRPLLTISKCTVSGTTNPVTLAGSVNYAIHIENTGDRIAYDVTDLLDKLPQGLKYAAGTATVRYCSSGASTYSCGDDLTSDINCSNISIGSALTESVETSPFGGDSQQDLSFQVRNAMDEDQIEPDGFYAVVIPTDVSCESVADNTGLDFPIGSHPDDDGLVDGCTDPSLDAVNSIGNTITGIDYSTYDGINPEESFYTSDDSNTVSLNTDHDGDGRLTSEEGTADNDGDGVPNYLDTDSDDNGTIDSADSALDTDMDGTPDYADTDDDNDGLTDSEELTFGGGVVDTDMDGIDNSMDPDSDGDGIIDGEDGGNDADGDGIENALDDDSDNDGILDFIEVGLGQYDSNGDGVLSALEITNSMLDTNTDGAISASELPGGTFPDSDGDGVFDYLDTDSDNDGVGDLEDWVLAQITPAQLASIDANSNGQIDSAMERADLYDIIGDADGNVEESDLSDTDMDTVFNHLDKDSDNDGIPDLIENGRFICDSNGNGEVSVMEISTCTGTPDTNMDGVIQHAELSIGDQDSDSFFNYVDLDSDNDGLGDIIEGHTVNIDGNNDGNITEAEYSTAYGSIGNNDSVMTVDELADSETVPDGTPDYFDDDSDGDSILDLHESDSTETYPTYSTASLVLTYANLFDTDSDSIPDFRDLDSDADGFTDSQEAGDVLSNTVPVDTDGDLIPDFQDTDADDDGLLDADEFTLMSDPTLADTDNDGCTDSCEVYGTQPPAEISCPFIGHASAPGTVMSPISDPTDADTDDGGTNDCDEANEPSDPRNPLDDPFIDEDADNDGLTNGEEAASGTDLNDPDSDADGCTDGCEVFGTTPMCVYDDASNSAWFPGMGSVMSPITNPNVQDSDSDGCNDCLEATTMFTNPNVVDTDSDGAGDCVEYNAGSDPNDMDTDNDGLLDGEEINTLNTDPNSNDTDGDGCLDGTEVNTYGSNPLADPDSDNDGLTDCQEDGTYGTDRNDPDTDGGGIGDGLEVNTFGTDPLDPADDCPTNRDSDGDGMTDCEEIDRGLDPNNKNDVTPRGSGTIGFLDFNGCRSGSNPGGLLLMLLAAMMMVLRKKNNRTSSKQFVWIVGLIVLSYGQAHAINVQYLTPKILNPDGHQALSSTTLEPGKIAVGAYFTWTKSPLEFGSSGDGDSIDDIVSWVFTQDLLFGVGLAEQFSFQVHAPFHVYNSVENFGEYNSTEDFNIGDVTLQGLWQLQPKDWNAVGGTFGFGLVPFVTFPTGDETRFFGNKDITFGGFFVVDRWSAMQRDYFTLNLGGRYRSNVENIGSLEIGSELLGKLGYVHRFLNSEGWQVFAELSGSMSLHDTKEVNSPGELYAGLQKVSKNQRWKWTLGGSRGGNNGYGAPDMRLYTGISYTNKTIPKKPKPPAPRPKPVPVVQPEPKKIETGMLNLKIVDSYGEKINTQVKIMTERESEPLFSGKISELNKTVNEGVIMVIVGKDDEKPLKKIFRIKANQDNNYTVVLEQKKEEKLDLKGKIFFASGSDALNAEAKAILLDAYEKIVKAKLNSIRIEAHTDNMGKDENNLELSIERANSVRQYLIQLGLDGEKIEAVGKGEVNPIASNENADGRALNRRVEFYVK